MRFAHEHAPKAPLLVFWLLAGLFLLLVAVPVAVFNLAVDPFDFRLAPHAPLIREKIMRKEDTMLWSAGELRRISPAVLDGVTIAVAGDSRAESLCSDRFFPRVFKLGADHILNLAVGGASFEETVAVLEAELPRLPRLRGVILAIPMERAAVVEQNRAPNAIKIANTPLLYALGLGTLASSVELLDEQKTAAADGQPSPERRDSASGALVDVSEPWLDVPGNLEKAKALAELPLKKSEQRVVNQWRKKLAAIDPVLLQRRVRDVIAPLVARLRARGVAVVFYFPPLHPDVVQAWTPQLAGTQRGYLAQLAKLGAIEDFSVGARDGIEPEFGDASHVVPEIARAIMGDIYLRNFAKR